MTKLLHIIVSSLIFALGATAHAQFKIPPLKEVTLDNGLKVVFIPQSEVPLIHVNVAVRAGSAQDGNAWGLASLTASALDLGTKSFSKKQIEDMFDQNGFTLETSTSNESTNVSASGASEDSEKLLKVLSEMIRVPTFPAKEVDKLRSRSVSFLRKSKESPNQIGSDIFERVYFGTHPYGSPDDGVVETVQKLQAADLSKFHKSYFQPQNAIVVVAGDFKPETMQALIAKEFGTWPKGSSVPGEVEAPVAARSETEVVIVDKADARETTFRIGGPGPKTFSPDWAKIAVLNTVLGGRFTSLLNEALRVKSGYTYGARSRFAVHKSTGSFQISTFTANETTFKTLDLALETYQNFVKQGIDQKTLDSAKAYVKGQFPPGFETLESLANLAVELFVYGVPQEKFNQFEADVNSLTLEEANKLIKQYFPVDNLTILMIGKASDLTETAKKYGKVRTVPIARVDGIKVL